MSSVINSLPKTKNCDLEKKLSSKCNETENTSKNLVVAIELIQSLFRSKKETQLIQKKISNNSPLVKTYRQLSANTNTILDGYGEYLVYQKKDDLNKPISQKLYKSVYEIINKPGPFPKSRTLYIREEIQKIDPSLDIIFIPRTLYELIYIQAAIQEEVKKTEICDLQSKFTNKYKKNKYKENFLKKFENCWHICQFTDYSLPDNDNLFLQHLAYRMNNLALKKLSSIQPLTGKQITQLTERELEFFKDHRKNFPSLYYDSKIKKKFGASYGGAINFGLPHLDERTICYPMGIKDEDDAQIARNAIALECDNLAQNALILYRAEKHLECDEHKLPEPKDTSLSYGTSLFAGAFLDGGANVFYYTVEKARDTFAVIVPYLDKKPPFFIPNSHPIRQLFSQGEFFHARSLLSKEASKKASKIAGIDIYKTEPKQIPPYLYSALGNDTLLSKLEEYHSRAIHLTPLDRTEDRLAMEKREKIEQEFLPLFYF